MHERSTAPFAEPRGGSSKETPPIFLEAVNSIETKNEFYFFAKEKYTFILEAFCKNLGLGRDSAHKTILNIT
jgi:hypothetical protein